MSTIGPIVGVVVALLVLGFILSRSIRKIGPLEVGVKVKPYGKQSEGLIAFNGEAGYQANLLHTGIYLVPFWVKVETFPIVQIGDDEVGMVISQIGDPLDPGMQSGIWKDEFGYFEDPRAFLDGGGQKGVQREVLKPGTVAAIHPVAFLVLTPSAVYGKPVGDTLDLLRRGGARHRVEEVVDRAREGDGESTLTAANLGFDSDKLRPLVIPPGKVGVVTTLDGPPLESDQVAGRLGGFADIEEAEQQLREQHPFGSSDSTEDREIHGDDEPEAEHEQVGEDQTEPEAPEDNAERADATSNQHGAWLKVLSEVAQPLLDIVLRRRLEVHSSYQNFQAFLDHDGRMGVQHDVISPGRYNLNPFLVHVDVKNMVQVGQSEVAVIRSAVGLRPEDVSGEEFRYGNLTLPGHRGLWVLGLKTGQYALNPDIYTPLAVPTNIVTLSWANAETAAQELDSELSPIVGTSKDGFNIDLELQVQVHVPADQAPHLIAQVGAMDHLVNGILHPVVGAFFREAMQSRTATEFIEQRETIQEEALRKIKTELTSYFVETRGVYIQAVKYPEQIADILQEREIATQQQETFGLQKQAEEARIEVEQTKGEADAQAALATARVNVDIAEHEADAEGKKAKGEASKIEQVGEAKAKQIQAEGEAQAASYEAQQKALGKDQTAAVAMLNAIGQGKIKITPDIVAGEGGSLSGAVLALVARNMQQSTDTNGATEPPAPAAQDDES